MKIEKIKNEQIEITAEERKKMKGKKKKYQATTFEIFQKFMEIKKSYPNSDFYQKESILEAIAALMAEHIKEGYENIKEEFLYQFLRHRIGVFLRDPMNEDWLLIHIKRQKKDLQELEELGLEKFIRITSGTSL